MFGKLLPFKTEYRQRCFNTINYKGFNKVKLFEKCGNNLNSLRFRHISKPTLLIITNLSVALSKGNFHRSKQSLESNEFLNALPLGTFYTEMTLLVLDLT